MIANPTGRAANELTKAAWFRSSYSGANGDCVEAAVNLPGIVPVRDSMDPSGPALIVGATAFASFIREVRKGRFDR
ncbi:DUF397 domain-containing protein [Streptomyces sp. NPDC093707]|uniref:DUF397 domain-containing protein n=1 Tax=Streptomyces sp. NPDC093707 TaxID=3154984 RepID=UPI00344FD602